MDKEFGYLKDYVEHLAYIKKFSPHTVKAYRQDIEQFLNYFKDSKRAIDKDTIRDYISHRFQKTRNRSTIARKTYALRTFYAYLLSRGKIEKNPFDAVSTPKADKKLPKILTEKEMCQFLDRLPEETFLELRNKAAFEFLYATGLRISELTHLKRTDIDFKENLVRVLGKGSKERIVPFNERAGALLLRYLNAAGEKFKRVDPYIFLNARGSKITERSLERILRRVFKEIMQSGKNVYPHLFRHSFATHLLQRGANLRAIQELLGHANLSTTEKYTNLNYADLLNVYKRYHPRD